MPTRVADTIKQQNDLKSFPVAYSEDIWLDENKGEGDANYKDLQTLFNENKLGGSGLPTPVSKDKLLVSTENEETSELEWSQVDKSTVGDSPFIGTEEEWEELSLEEKAKYKIVNFLDDDGSGESVDKYSTEEVKTNKVWIDGKPIYRRVFNVSTSIVILDSWTNIYTESWVSTIKTIVNSSTMLTNFQGENVTYSPLLVRKVGSTISLISPVGMRADTIVLEYTKTN